MSRAKIILLGLFVIVLGALGGAIYYASTLISPEEMRSLTLKKLKSTFPNAEVELGEIEFNIGPTFNFNLASLSMKLKKEHGAADLMSVEDVSVGVPVWSILMGGGSIDVRVDSPKLSIKTIEKESNWSKALAAKSVQLEEEKKKEGTQDTNKNDGSLSLVVPAFLAKSELNLRMNNVLLEHQLAESKGSLKISKFLIKNLNFDSATAFEIDSDLSFSSQEGQDISFKTLVIGQFNLSDFIKSKELPLMAMIKIDALKTPFTKGELNEIKTNIDLKIAENGNILGNIETTLLRDTRFFSDFKLSDTTSFFENINLKLPLSEAAEVLDLSISNMNMNSSAFELDGRIDLNEKSEISPNLNFTLTRPFSLKMQGEDFSVTAQGAWKQKDLEAKLTTKAFAGTIVTEIISEIDINNPPSLENLPQFKGQLNASNMRFSKEWIHGVLYAEKKQVKTEEKIEAASESKQSQTSVPPVILPPGETKIELDNIIIDGYEFSGNGLLTISPKTVAMKKFNFSYSEGQGSLTHLTEVKDKGLESSFNFNLKRFNLIGMQAFLPPQLGTLKGIFSTTINAKVESPLRQNGPILYDVALEAQGKSGEAQILIELGKKINDLIGKIPQVAKEIDTQKPLEIDGAFDEMGLKGHFTHDHYKVRTLRFVGDKNKFTLSGGGDIYPPSSQKPKKSQMDFDLVLNDGKFSKTLSETFGSSSLPFRLEGESFSMKPDYAYSVERLAKKALKTKGEQVLKKEVKKIENKLKDELKDKGKEQIKKLFGL